MTFPSIALIDLLLGPCRHLPTTPCTSSSLDSLPVQGPVEVMCSSVYKLFPVFDLLLVKPLISQISPDVL